MSALRSAAYLVQRLQDQRTLIYYAGRNEALGASRWTTARDEALGMSKASAAKLAREHGGFIGRKGGGR